MPQNVIFIMSFSNNPPHEWTIDRNPIKTLLDLMIEFSDRRLYRIGRCYPLNFLLWKYVYYTGWTINAMSLNCFVVCVNDNIPHTGIFPDMVSVLTVMSVLVVDIFLVLREFLRIAPSTIPFETNPLLFHIGDFLFKSNPLYSARIPDA